MLAGEWMELIVVILVIFFLLSKLVNWAYSHKNNNLPKAQKHPGVLTNVKHYRPSHFVQQAQTDKQDKAVSSESSLLNKNIKQHLKKKSQHHHDKTK